MEAKQETWEIWSDRLHRWGMQNWAISFLEVCGPLTILAAQLLYMSQPFFNPTDSQGRMNMLANMLEDTSETKKFVNYLRESAQK